MCSYFSFYCFDISSSSASQKQINNNHIIIIIISATPAFAGVSRFILHVDKLWLVIVLTEYKKRAYTLPIGPARNSHTARQSRYRKPSDGTWNLSLDLSLLYAILLHVNCLVLFIVNQILISQGRLYSVEI